MIVIVDYDAGNLTSVKRALDHLGLASVISADPAEIVSAERVIFPGVGHAAAAMQSLRSRGLDRALTQIYQRGTPILGICLGAQIVLTSSEESGEPCLGLIDGVCPRLRPTDPALKIPHMGWDRISVARPHPVLRGVRDIDEFYFVHSYYPQPAKAQDVLASCEYEIVFPAIIGRGNLIAMQFHPEKSGEVGLSLLRNFNTWDGVVC